MNLVIELLREDGQSSVQQQIFFFQMMQIDEMMNAKMLVLYMITNLIELWNLFLALYFNSIAPVTRVLDLLCLCHL